MPDTESMETKMQALRVHYRSQLGKRAEVLESLLHNINIGARAELQRHAHQLAGTAASYGFADVSAAARQLEESLGGSQDDEVHALAEALIALCRQHAAMAAAAEAAPQVNTVLPLLLVIDDDPMVGMLLRKLLVNEARVQAVETLQAAAIFLDQRPRLVLLDYELEQGQNGLAVLAAIRVHEVWRDIPVVMLSGNTDDTTRDNAMRAGAQGYLCKPISVNEGIHYLRTLFSHPYGVTG